MRQNLKLISFYYAPCPAEGRSQPKAVIERGREACSYFFLHFSPCTYKVRKIKHHLPVGKECLENKKHLYLYKEIVEVPPLAMVDDIVTISECGHKTTAMNAFIDTRASCKKLQFGVNKCKKIHVGKTKSKTKCQNLKIGEWKVKNVNNIETNELSREDTYNGETEITETEEEKYLGDIISKSAKNVRNITARKNKSIGICRKIMKSLQDIWFGKYHYEVAILLKKLSPHKLLID